MLGDYEGIYSGNYDMVSLSQSRMSRQYTSQIKWSGVP